MALEDKARGQRIAQLRKRRRLTQQAMAERLKIGYRTYQTWESGTMPEWPNLEKLADFFGVKPEHIVGEDEMPARDDGPPMESRLAELLAAMQDRQAAIEEELQLLRAERATADAEVLGRIAEVHRAIEDLPRP